MISGVVPIVTNVGGNPELVVDGESGFIVEPGDAGAIRDALLQLYNDRELLSRISEAARQRVLTEFTVEKTARETIAVYRDLLD